MPKIQAKLTSEGIDIEPEDLAAETELAANTMISYGGKTPYECLYGELPHDS